MRKIVIFMVMLFMACSCNTNQFASIYEQGNVALYSTSGELLREWHDVSFLLDYNRCHIIQNGEKITIAGGIIITTKMTSFPIFNQSANDESIGLMLNVLVETTDRIETHLEMMNERNLYSFLRN